MIEAYIYALVDHAVKNSVISEADRIYAANRLAGALKIDTLRPCESAGGDLESILKALDDYAFEKGLITENTTLMRDFFDAGLMGLVTPFPSQVIDSFWSDYKTSPELATDRYYAFSRATDYIREYRVKKDLKWTVESEYGTIDITVNLSKPEKDPKAIAAARNAPAGDRYPLCVLCRENEGYSGRLDAAPRQNHRIIPITLAGEQWYFQYSPYVYYNEHCIALSGRHVPMKIERKTFRRITDFVEMFPHYFIGSNADLPIVGGSVLSHDHMQGGRYVFAMEKAPVEREFAFDGFEDVKAGRVRWPMSVIRLRSADKSRLVELSDRILKAWRSYSDPRLDIFSETGGEPHNTVTPIGRRRGEDYEMDLVLRNNITIPEHPLGLFHPHSELHNIKKENIGLIEVMGLAVLPARLKAEMEKLEELILAGKSPESDPSTAKHAAWFGSFASNYTFTTENTRDILYQKIGETFVKVLEDSGVFKRDPEGFAGFDRFIGAVNRG